MSGLLTISIQTNGAGSAAPDRHALGTSGAIQNHLKDSVTSLEASLKKDLGDGTKLGNALEMNAQVNGKAMNGNQVYEALQDVYSGKSAGTVAVKFDEGALSFEQTLFSGPVTPQNMEKVAIAVRSAAKMLEENNVTCQRESISAEQCQAQAVTAVQTTLKAGFER